MLISERITATYGEREQHASGSFPDRVLAQIEQALPARCENSVETGCGKSTILFSNIADHHTSFTLDDRHVGEASSIAFFMESPLTRFDRVKVVLGPTQKTLPDYRDHRDYDIVLIDGPHGFPFPELEYFHLVPHLKTGGFLIIDDVHIPSIGLMADILKEDEMFEVHALIETTLILRRTGAPLLDPFGDGWWEQSFNRRRFKPGSAQGDKIVLRDGYELHSMQTILDENLQFEGFLKQGSGDSSSKSGKTLDPASALQSLEKGSDHTSPFRSALKNIYQAKVRIGIGEKTFTFALSNIERNLRKRF